MGRSIAHRGSSRSNCHVKAILHGRIETGAEIQGGAQNKEKAGIRCRGIDIRKGRIASGRIETGAGIRCRGKEERKYYGNYLINTM